ncbi:polygalacturonase-like [Abrus precatorius]|uniref:Polygalacturonase-like n=1 Tax=Abrus precatorius TaxID=3816 RepID=A0A8B8JJE3_ABRPR|nr:polygalacturonase-like [Abrus precatorius]
MAAKTLIVLLTLYMLNPTSAKSTTFNVVDFGATPDGVTDSTEAFLSAWSKACGSPKPAGIHVPKGEFLLGRAVAFSGQCANNAISITLRGTLLAPSDYRFVEDADHWLTFDQVSGVSIHGGTLDARASSLWNCKTSTNSKCPVGAPSLRFRSSDHVVVTGLTSLNSQLFHILVDECHNVKLHGVKLMADGNSPNTDGIHVQFSTDVTILKPRIRTGDDCISIGPGSKNLWIEDVACGPGHGISIGSLGWSLDEPGVKNVTVLKTTFSKTLNGFRIKTWGRPSDGFVNDVHFEHASMNDVLNPIVIDQSYCPSYSGCPTQASGVKISDVSYKDVHGTSASPVAVKFDCSSEKPCERITLEDVKLTYKNQTPQALCKHAGGTTTGTVQPRSCFGNNN